MILYFIRFFYSQDVSYSRNRISRYSRTFYFPSCISIDHPMIRCESFMDWLCTSCICYRYVHWMTFFRSTFRYIRTQKDAHLYEHNQSDKLFYHAREYLDSCFSWNNWRNKYHYRNFFRFFFPPEGYFLWIYSAFCTLSCCTIGRRTWWSWILSHTGLYL